MHQKHHRSPNVPFHDPAIESFDLVRLHPRAKRRWIHRFQHLYIFLVYAFVPLFQVYFLELVSYTKGLHGFRRGPRALARLLRGYATKLLVAGYSIGALLVCVALPVWKILLACLAG